MQKALVCDALDIALDIIVRVRLISNQCSIKRYESSDMQLEPMPRRKLLKLGVFGVVALGSATAFMLGDRGGDERAAGESPSLLVFNRDHAQTAFLSIRTLPKARSCRLKYAL